MREHCSAQGEMIYLSYGKVIKHTFSMVIIRALKPEQFAGVTDVTFVQKYTPFSGTTLQPIGGMR